MNKNSIKFYFFRPPLDVRIPFFEIIDEVSIEDMCSIQVRWIHLTF